MKPRGTVLVKTLALESGRCGFESWLWHMSEMGLWAVHFTFVILRFLMYKIRKIILPTSLELNLRIKDVSGVEYVAWHTVDIVQMSTTIITIWKDKYLLCGFRPVSWLVWICFFFFLFSFFSWRYFAEYCFSLMCPWVRHSGNEIFNDSHTQMSLRIS